ncbi:MAG: hypothetical protein HYZ53_15760 [Planctomycetes bacterium]|nr:hypothetical protein [Planctomycetota bacterium]
MPNPVQPSHLVHVDLVKGRFHGTNAEQLTALFAAAARRKLVVHFHGGLVPRHSAWNIVDRLTSLYQGAGADPVFFVWNSDIFTLITEHWREIAQEELFKRLVWRLAQFLAGKFAESAGARGSTIDLPDDPKSVPAEGADLAKWLAEREAERPLPPAGQAPEPSDEDLLFSKTQRQQVEKVLNLDPKLMEEAAGVAATVLAEAKVSTDPARSAGAAAPRPTRLSKAVRAALVKDAGADEAGAGARGPGAVFAIAKYGVKILKAVLLRYARGRDHGAYVTLVEEALRTLYADDIGNIVWSEMKQDTADAFGPAADCGGTAFVKGLAAGAHAGKGITLVAHSAGAIFAGHFLEAFDREMPPQAKVDVVFLAPACTYQFLAERLDLLRRRVRHIRVFALKDKHEHGYFQVPILYGASLLYLVSGLAEPEVDAPLVGMQRYQSGAAPYNGAAIQDVLRWSTRDAFVWSDCDEGPGRRADAVEHGDFDENDKVKESLVHVIGGGW